MDNSRSGKRKLFRKQKRCQQIIQNEANIECSDNPTLNIAICNAGLSTGLRPEDILTEIGSAGKVTNIVMLPGKSYCFLVFTNVKEAISVFDQLHGKSELAQNKGVLYLSYFNSVPKVSNPWKENLPDGLILLRDFITLEDEANLLNAINRVDQTAYDKDLKHRQVKHFGYEFIYGSNSVDKNNPLNEKIPTECDIIWPKLQDKKSDLNWYKPDQLTVNKYEPGQGIPPHVDTHSAFLDPIISLSLGSDIVMEFRSSDGKHISILLPSRSLLIMSGESRYNWTHGITPRMMDIVPSNNEYASLTTNTRRTRVSFTFRKLRDNDCDCSYPIFCDSYQNRYKTQSENLELNEIAAKLEEENVHKIYNEIANHFSETRHSPWPNVNEFIKRLPKGAIFLDIGCGNGKYLVDQKHIFSVGCDRSESLLKVCQNRQLNVFQCDCLAIPFRANSVDACMSIAVIHHLASTERRLRAITEMVRVLALNGKGLIYVWAKNQEADEQKSSYLRQNKKNHRNGGKSAKTGIESKNNSIEISLDSDVRLPIHTNRTQFQHQDVLVPWKLKNKKTKSTEKLFLRYYHVFEEHELEKLCGEVDGIRIVKSFYDQGNWCVIFEKIKENKS